MNPTLVLMGLMALGWIGTSVVLMGRTELRVMRAVGTERNAQIAACDAKINDFAAVINGEADREVNAANEAAELIPMLKDRAQLEQRCAVSPYCRKEVPGGTADANGAD